MQGLFKAKNPTVMPESGMKKKPSLLDVVEELKKAKSKMYEENAEEQPGTAQQETSG